MARYKDSGSASKEYNYNKYDNNNNNNNNCNSPTPDLTTQGKHLTTNDTLQNGKKPHNNNNNSKTMKTHNRRHRTRYFITTTHESENIALRTTPMKRIEQNRTNRVKVHPRWDKIHGISHLQRSTDNKIEEAKLVERWMKDNLTSSDIAQTYNTMIREPTSTTTTTQLKTTRTRLTTATTNDKNIFTL